MENYVLGRIVKGVRKPAVAGIYYEARRERLLAQVEALLSQASSVSHCDILALLVPHAGYIYSGPVAASAYKALALQKSLPKLIVIFGPNHTGLGTNVSVYPGRSFETPLGTMDVDVDLSKAVAESLGAELDYYAHLYEHSIEVQLPFLQYIYSKREGYTPKITAIVSKGFSIGRAEKLAEVLAETTSSEERVLFIATSNLTQFKHVSKVRELDSRILRAVENLDIDGLMAVVEDGANPCGLEQIAAFIFYARRVGGRVELLSYSTSADVAGSVELSVGYAALRVCKT